MSFCTQQDIKICLEDRIPVHHMDMITMPHVYLRPMYISQGITTSTVSASASSSMTTLTSGATTANTFNTTRLPRSSTSSKELTRLNDEITCLLDAEFCLETELTSTRLKIDELKEERWKAFCGEQRLSRERLERSKLCLGEDGATAWGSRRYVEKMKCEIGSKRRARFEMACQRIEDSVNKVCTALLLSDN